MWPCLDFFLISVFVKDDKNMQLRLSNSGLSNQESFDSKVL